MKNIILIILLCTTALAQTIATPAYFYGTATVNGDEISKDSIVTAEIDGKIKGSFEITEQGIYGSYDTHHKLGVTGWAEDAGKTVKFYLTIPGMIAIEAEETAKWNSGNIVELSLTFNGDLVPIPEEEKDEKSSSKKSSSSSGSSSSGTATSVILSEEVNVEIQSASCYDIKQDYQFDIKTETETLTRLQLLLTQDSNACFQFSDEAVAKAENAYAYFTIDSELSSDTFDTVIAKFRVKQDWFRTHSEDIVLQHFDNGWTDLKTINEGSDDNHRYYRAVLTNLGEFAVVSENLKSDEMESTEQMANSDKEVDLTEPVQNGMGSITGAVIGVQGNTYVLIASIMMLIAGISLFTGNRLLIKK